jgi:hypothetical protein
MGTPLLHQRFKNHFLKAFYDAIRHDAAFIPDLVVINNAVAGLEYLRHHTEFCVTVQSRKAQKLGLGGAPSHFVP